MLLVVTNEVGEAKQFPSFPSLTSRLPFAALQKSSRGMPPTNAWSQDRPTWFCRVRLGVTLDLDLL